MKWPDWLTFRRPTRPESACEGERCVHVAEDDWERERRLRRDAELEADYLARVQRVHDQYLVEGGEEDR